MPHKLINLPKILDDRGNLSFLESEVHLPFKIKRSYLIYDVPGGEKRGGHAFVQQHEFIIALSGSFDVVINDGNIETKYSLNRSYYGVYVPNKLWRHLDNFSTNALCLVMASTNFDAEDYIRDFDTFKLLKA